MLAQIAGSVIGSIRELHRSQGINLAERLMPNVEGIVRTEYHSATQRWQENHDEVRPEPSAAESSDTAHPQGDATAAPAIRSTTATRHDSVVGLEIALFTSKGDSNRPNVPIPDCVLHTSFEDFSCSMTDPVMVAGDALNSNNGDRIGELFPSVDLDLWSFMDATASVPAAGSEHQAHDVTNFTGFPSTAGSFRYHPGSGIDTTQWRQPDISYGMNASGNLQQSTLWNERGHGAE